jgi:hypothetical protein
MKISHAIPNHPFLRAVTREILSAFGRKDAAATFHVSRLTSHVSRLTPDP